MIYDNLEPNDLMTKDNTIKIFKEHGFGICDTECATFLDEYGSYIDGNAVSYRVQVIADYLGY